ncbi:hypothetical protein RE628_13055 [Paenibacillus sp. D2_2]|uniref:hypothetical protein n=1 Tax=Paenibacillus sp. D2_2 TaxID=3073092 RepID=UPI00281633E9|nr:hypothetical protein [Paenibacillus sp. D2_2]WMT43108.1 hypothetical protein RE628_13055 [Paenibacillus sp. D2_2]
MINIKKSLISSLVVSAVVSAVVIIPSPSHAASVKNTVSSNTTVQNTQSQTATNPAIEKVIQTGMKYLGTRTSSVPTATQRQHLTALISFGKYSKKERA